MQHDSLQVFIYNQTEDNKSLITRAEVSIFVFVNNFTMFLCVCVCVCVCVCFQVVFTISDPEQRFHIPLLMSRFSYSTYRGS